MSKVKQTKPGQIQFSDDKKYRATVLHVTGRTENGRPRECRVLHDDESIDLQGGEQFVIVYFPVEMLQPGN